MSEPQHLAALGSSFAAGPGIEPIADRRAMRSAGNYAHLVADGLGARLSDLTVSGATTGTILDTPQRFLLRRFPPQLDGLPGDVDLVTVTAGGNDLGYIGSMVRLAWAHKLGSGRMTGPAGRLIGRRGVPVVGPEDRRRAVAGLVRIVEAVRERAPQARVLLVDYLTVIGEGTVRAPDVPFMPSELEAFREIAARLADAFGSAAATTGAELVAASTLSAGHALGSDEPWISGLRASPLRKLASSFHPNAAGMRAVADEILRLVKG